MVFGHSPVRGSNNISLGNQSISNRRTSHGWLTATAVLVGAALVALGLYGTVRLVEGDKPPAESGTATGQVGAGGSAAKVVDDRELAAKILPDMDSVPTGWVLDDGFPAEGKCPPGCQGRLISVKTAYNVVTRGRWVWMEVHTFSSVEAAKASYFPVKRRLENEGEEWKDTLHPEPASSSSRYPVAQQSSISLQGLGSDEYEAISWSISSGGGWTSATGVSAVVRVGTVVAHVGVMDNGGHGGDNTLLQALTQAVVERAWQAQRGETPTALATCREPREC
ncbi:hypothetical protein [Amycolatopsis magusensis]|uniref:hypothetical protein n=1 Tax=Amycolatopsis magusensis TaxID=882444 RepID=UPI003793B7B0